MIHTGDITDLSKPDEFDNAAQLIREAKLDVHYVPGEHELLMKARARRISTLRQGHRARAGTVSTTTACTSLASTMWSISRPAALDASVRQLAWLADLKDKSTPRLSSSSPISRCGRSMPSGAGAPTMACGRSNLKRFGSVTVLNGHIHQIVQKVEGNMTFHTARSTCFPQPAPGTAPAPGPMTVPAEQLRSMLGIAREVCAWATSRSPSNALQLTLRSRGK